jgi:hypothetical protein
MKLLPNRTQIVQSLLSVVITSAWLGISLAATTTISASPQQITPPTNLGIMDLIERILNLVAPIIVLVFMAVIMYGGFVRMTAAGDPDKEKQSSQILLAGIVGFVIIALAPVIVNLLGRIIGTGSLVQ